MIERLEVVGRLRPIDLVAPRPAVDLGEPGDSSLTALPRPAPYVAVVADLATGPGPGPGGQVSVGLTSGPTRLVGSCERGRLGLQVTDAKGRTTLHRSRRHGRSAAPPDALGLTLTGTHLTVWAREQGTWLARGRVDLHDRVDTRDEGWLDGLTVSHDGAASRLVAGGFGQVGLRDLRWVTHADGTPVREHGALWLTATSAGPGFFDTGHTSVWRVALDEPLRLEHTADLFFRRPDRPGVHGDHATHLVRDGDGWVVATSTWGDFEASDPDRHVRTVLARTRAHLLAGEHVLDTSPLRLPTDGLASVGVWDPHLVRTDEGWLVAFVSASEYFRFHPCLASGPALEELSLLAADRTRRATEGVTLLELDGTWRVLASDGRDNPSGLRKRMPVLDLGLREVDVLDAPYPTNLPWPTLARLDDGWLMVTFDGTPAGGPLPGYGTHGDVVVMREARD